MGDSFRLNRPSFCLWMRLSSFSIAGWGFSLMENGNGPVQVIVVSFEVRLDLTQPVSGGGTKFQQFQACFFSFILQLLKTGKKHMNIGEDVLM